MDQTNIHQATKTQSIQQRVERQQQYRQQIVHNIPSNQSRHTATSNKRKLRTIILLHQYCRRFRYLNPVQLYRKYLSKHKNESAIQSVKPATSYQALKIMHALYLLYVN